jgi:hypothetical protein
MGLFFDSFSNEIFNAEQHVNIYRELKQASNEYIEGSAINRNNLLTHTSTQLINQHILTEIDRADLYNFKLDLNLRNMIQLFPSNVLSVININSSSSLSQRIISYYDDLRIITSEVEQAVSVVNSTINYSTEVSEVFQTLLREKIKKSSIRLTTLMSTFSIYSNVIFISNLTDSLATYVAYDFSYVVSNIVDFNEILYNPNRMELVEQITSTRPIRLNADQTLVRESLSSVCRFRMRDHVIRARLAREVIMDSLSGSI